MPKLVVRGTSRSVGGPQSFVLGSLLAAMTATYWDIGVALVRQWASDDNYSHGFLIVPLAIYFGWRRREALAAAPARPSALGLLVILASLAILVAGVAAAELVLARLSFVTLVAGCTLFLFGPAHLRLLAFPIGFLLLMIPLPAIVFNEIALPLQLFASQVGEGTLRSAGVPVLREGNVLELASMRLEVAEACSGIRSLVSLLAFALVLGQVSGCSTRRLWVLAVATVPIAIAANAARVAATGLAAHAWGTAAAEGFLHTASGSVVFVVAVIALATVDRLLRTSRTMLPSTS